MKKRILSLLLCLVLCLSVLPMSAFAQELPSMQNVRINPQGNLSWDSVSGAAGYYVGIKSGETIHGDNFATSSGVNLNSFCRRYSSICDHTGDYTVLLYAWDSHADRITEIWTGTYHFVKETQQQTTYTVTFDMNGHGDSITALTVNEGDQLSKPADPVAEGWKFEGWYTDEALTEEYVFGALVFENITLHAKWTEIEHYSVTYDANGGTGSMPSEQIYVNSEGIAVYSFPTCGFTAPTGKVFDHWEVEGNNNTFSEADQLAIFGDVIVKPIWAEDLAPMQNVSISEKGILSWDAFPNAAKYTVAVSSNPIGPYWGVDTNELSYNLFDLCSRSNLTKGKTAYVKLAACGSDGNYNSEEWIGGFLYPTTAQGCYYVTFESNGGGGEMPLTPVYANNTGFFFTLPQCEFTAPTGKKFDHWDVEGNCKQLSGGTELELFGNIILKPIWVAQNTASTIYTVSFNMNGHGDQIAAQMVNEGAKATKPTDPSASGYTFEGWYADATFSAAFDFDTAIAADTTLYAKWTQNSSTPSEAKLTLTVSHDPADGTPVTIGQHISHYYTVKNTGSEPVQLDGIYKGGARLLQYEGITLAPGVSRSLGQSGFDVSEADITQNAQGEKGVMDSFHAAGFANGVAVNSNTVNGWHPLKTSDNPTPTPDKPNTPTNPPKDNLDNSPKTGDARQTVLWIGMLMVSFGTAAAAVQISRKKDQV